MPNFDVKNSPQAKTPWDSASSEPTSSGSRGAGPNAGGAVAPNSFAFPNPLTFASDEPPVNLPWGDKPGDGGGLAEAATTGLFSWFFGSGDDKKSKDDDKTVSPAKKASELIQQHLAEVKKQLEAQKKAEEEEKRRKREAEIDEDAKKDPLFKKDPKQARELADARKDLEGMFEVVG